MCNRLHQRQCKSQNASSFRFTGQVTARPSNIFLRIDHILRRYVGRAHGTAEMLMLDALPRQLIQIDLAYNQQLPASCGRAQDLNSAGCRVRHESLPRLICLVDSFFRFERKGKVTGSIKRCPACVSLCSARTPLTFADAIFGCAIVCTSFSKNKERFTTRFVQSIARISRHPTHALCAIDCRVRRVASADFSSAHRGFVSHTVRTMVRAICDFLCPGKAGVWLPAIAGPRHGLGV